MDPMPPEEVVTATPSGVVLSRLPAPHRAEAKSAAVIPARADVAALRAMTGNRVTDDPMAFAIAAAASLTRAKRVPDPVPTDGEKLAAWAAENATAIDDAASARAGDLLVFDKALGDRPASLWAVVLGQDQRGVIEMLYVGGGVVRRGFVDPAAPHVARDASRTIHNTYLRHAKDWPPKGTRFLAGELLAATYRLR
jgi:hypothetical protein